jgi:uncharacterized protein YuzE
MRVEYTPQTNVAYLHLVEYRDEYGKLRTHSVSEENGTFLLDFAGSGLLIGIEFLNATKQLPEEVIKTVEIVSTRTGRHDSL